MGGPSLGWQVWGLPLLMLCFGTLGCSDAEDTGTAGGGVKVAGCTVEGAGSVSITDAAGAALFPATNAAAQAGLLSKARLRVFALLRHVSTPAYYYYGLGNEVQLSAEIIPVRLR